MPVFFDPCPFTTSVFTVFSLILKPYSSCLTQPLNFFYSFFLYFVFDLHIVPFNISEKCMTRDISLSLVLLLTYGISKLGFAMTIFKSCKGEFEHTKEKRERSPELSQNIPKKYRHHQYHHIQIDYGIELKSKLLFKEIQHFQSIASSSLCSTLNLVNISDKRKWLFNVHPFLWCYRIRINICR